MEFFTWAQHTAREFGLNRADQKRAWARSERASTAPRVSGPLLRDSIGLGVLLLTWSRDAAYIDRDGKPKVLSIRGPGRTFESLARQHLPNTPIAEAVRMACATAEVSRRPRGKIALLGSVMVKFSRANDNLVFAHTVRQVSQFLKTVIHNRALPTARQVNYSRLERMVIGVVSRDDVPEVIQEFKPQIYDLFQRIEAAMDLRQPKTPRERKKATAVSVGLFIAQEDELERVGMDSLAAVRRSGKGK